MIPPVEQILHCVQHSQEPAAGLQELITIGRRAGRSTAWGTLPAIDVDADVDAAAAWVASQVAVTRASGVYFGLDTLNERRGRGTNVEMGLSETADPAVTDTGWLGNITRRCDSHLIRGLYLLHRSYAGGIEAELESLLDYVLYLGYSGLVLAAALQRRRPGGRVIVAWGFHDGDIGPLCRWTPIGFERLAIEWLRRR